MKARKEFLKEYTKVWEKVKYLIGKKFYAEPVYSDNSKKVPKESCTYKCFSLISLDSVIQMGEKYYPQTLLEECKYKLTKKKIEDLITNDFDSSSKSDSESEGESGNEQII